METSPDLFYRRGCNSVALSQEGLRPRARPDAEPEANNDACGRIAPFKTQHQFLCSGSVHDILNEGMQLENGLVPCASSLPTLRTSCAYALDLYSRCHSPFVECTVPPLAQLVPAEAHNLHPCIVPQEQ